MLNELLGQFAATEKMPLLFIGHGSPMNAIEKNEFVQSWQVMGQTLPKPKAILCISAHWETRGTAITAMEKPRTIHDFGGFPQALFDVEYPVPGNPYVAAQVKSNLAPIPIHLDMSWGLDHGCWSVIKNMYPKADIPVLQLSLDVTRTPQQHYELAKELAALRTKGVLIIGSGNMVHNLRLLNWQHPHCGYDWAIASNDIFKQLIMNQQHQQLTDYLLLGKEAKLAIPSPEHYLPLLYMLGLQNKNEPISFFNDKLVMGSISMTSVMIG